MATNDQYFSLVKTSKSSWVAVRVNVEEPSIHRQIGSPEPLAGSHTDTKGTSTELFSQTAYASENLSERYPRLAIAIIALVIFAVSVTAEIEYLRQAGFSWH
jgi:hypothetical protein